MLWQYEYLWEHFEAARVTLPPGTLTEVPFRHLVEEPLATLRHVYADQGLVSDAPSSAQEESVRHHEGARRNHLGGGAETHCSSATAVGCWSGR